MSIIHANLEKNNEKIQDEEEDKNSYKKITFMNNYLKDCQDFNEDYTLTKLLGTGSTGVCYEAYLTKFPNYKTYCIKFIFLKENDRKKALVYKKKEIIIHSSLKSNYIIKIHKTLEIKKHLCVVMEKAKYGDLDCFKKNNIVLNKNLSETLLCYIASEVLKGLKYCHSLKIVHLDIKEQNILVCENLNIKLTDFSVSQDYKDFKDNDTVKMPKCGTSLYMSPEILQGSNIKVHQISKLDIYSLGVVLYYLAYNYYPFGLKKEDKKDFDLILNKIKHNELHFIQTKQLSYNFINFIKNCLNININYRYTIDEAMNDPWILGSEIIYKQKVKLNDPSRFLYKCIWNNIMEFNSYIENITKNSNNDALYDENMTTYFTNI